MRFDFRFLLSRRGSVQKTGIRAGLGLLSLLLLTACARPLVLDATLPRQVAELGCLSECRATREACNADARDEYRQCQAGYSSSFRVYRWCLASASEQGECGYPWWSCAENRFGYCTNRYRDCASACRPPSRS